MICETAGGRLLIKDKVCPQCGHKYFICDLHVGTWNCEKCGSVEKRESYESTINPTSGNTSWVARK
jgi:ribosomal protein L37AE/L43A